MTADANSASAAPLLARAAALDATDPLVPWADRLVPLAEGVVYFDGNSLGRPPRAALARAADELQAWARDLVGAWDSWVDLPFVVGDRLAPLLGAAPGTVVVGDSTTVQLHKTLFALAREADRPTILVDGAEFPTDRYVAAGVADALGGRVVHDTLSTHDAASFASVVERHRPDVVVTSVVDFRSGARADVAGCTAATGAPIVWDLSHAAGVVPLALDEWGVEAAVGCTYKYLHGGPGSPAFAYVAPTGRPAARRQPIWGWWGQRDQFLMGADYDPVDARHHYALGTPPVVQLALVDEGIRFVADAGIAAIDAKRAVLTDLAIACVADLDVELVTPRAPERRGGHVTVAHPDASRVVRAARTRDVIADFRPPDGIRMGFAPLSTSFADVVHGIAVIGDVLATGAHLALPSDPGRVT